MRITVTERPYILTPLIGSTVRYADPVDDVEMDLRFTVLSVSANGSVTMRVRNPERIGFSAQLAPIETVAVADVVSA